MRTFDRIKESGMNMSDLVSYKADALRDKQEELLSAHSDERISESLETPPELADRYRFIRELGHGAQGKVYLAEHLGGNELVAIKRLEIDSVQNWKDYELFHREAAVLKTLNIKGVARFIEAPDFTDIANPCAYIVQEYIEGQSLEKLMRSGYRLTMHKIFRLVLELIDILEQLHSHEPPIIHRDIKPANIQMKLLPSGGFEPYLIDFGAVSNPQIQSGGSTIAGTYGYMPPEQLMGRPVPASDIYSLAAMVAYLLSGVEPGEMQIVDFHLVIHPCLENVPRAVVSVLHQMLEPKVDKRLSDYQTLRDRFGLFMQERFDLPDDADGVSGRDLTLGRVNALGQRGNMDLWLSLPEATPRQIPQEYRELVEGHGMETQSVYPKLIKYNRSSRNYILTFIFVPVFFVFLGIILTLSGISDLKNGIGDVVMGSIFIIMGSLFSIIVIRSYMKSSYSKYIKDYNRHFPASGKKLFETLFSQGTKSIATVVSCDYMPALGSGIEFYYLTKMVEDYGTTVNGKHPLMPANDKLTGYYHLRPSFRLIYKFNPPDDDNPDDLYHTITLHTDFSETLKAGDPLPILYYINPQDNMDVMSMPFPYPLKDFFSYNDMIHYKR